MRFIVGFIMVFCMYLIVKPVVELFKLFGVLINIGIDSSLNTNSKQNNTKSDLQRNMKDISKNGFYL